MLSANLNVPKAVGHALVVGTEGCRAAPRQALSDIGYEVDESADPYAALIELCRRPLVYRAIVLSLQCLYRDELALITTVRRRFPHLNVWLSHTDGRQAALAEAMRLGAEALVDDKGIHRFAEPEAAPATPRPMTFRPVPSQEPESPEAHRASPGTRVPEPVLSADELRALLGD